MKKVYVVGTCDTKGDELAYAKAAILSAGAEALLIDVGTQGASPLPDISAAQGAAHHPEGAQAVLGLGAERASLLPAIPRSSPQRCAPCRLAFRS